MMFRDRQHAGRLLAAKLEGFREERPIVFGLTRGGVPVASEVALALGAPLEPMVVRKIGAPPPRVRAQRVSAERRVALMNARHLRSFG